MIKKITPQASGNSHIVDYVPNVKTHTAPVIKESYMDDNGDMQHILANGNVLSENNFVKNWGQRKGIINLKAKPKLIDGRRNFY
jgi:hypothetical protein